MYPVSGEKTPGMRHEQIEQDIDWQEAISDWHCPSFMIYSFLFIGCIKNVPSPWT
jgi:hypothetical protein